MGNMWARISRPSSSVRDLHEEYASSGCAESKQSSHGGAGGRAAYNVTVCIHDGLGRVNKGLKRV